MDRFHCALVFPSLSAFILYVSDSCGLSSGEPVWSSDCVFNNSDCHPLLLAVVIALIFQIFMLVSGRETGGKEEG